MTEEFDDRHLYPKANTQAPTNVTKTTPTVILPVKAVDEHPHAEFNDSPDYHGAARTRGHNVETPLSSINHVDSSKLQAESPVCDTVVNRSRL